jgi:hypothetical protein
VRRVNSTLRITTLAGAILIAATAVSAQPSRHSRRSYVEGVAESAFGNVTVNRTAPSSA